ARHRVRSASSAAAGGSSPTCVCSRAATGTRSRPIRTPTRSASASRVRWCDVRGRRTGVLTDAWLDSRPFRLKAEATIFYVGGSHDILCGRKPRYFMWVEFGLVRLQAFLILWLPPSGGRRKAPRV